MTARDWFEGIRAEVLECAKLERDVEDQNQSLGPRGQTFEASGRGSGASDGDAAVNHVIDMEAELDRRQARCDARVEAALCVLYGADGSGGLAAVKGSATADCICGYYLMGMKWCEVADELARPDSEDPRHWCMMRAHRAFRYIDRVGIEALSKS